MRSAACGPHAPWLHAGSQCMCPNLFPGSPRPGGSLPPGRSPAHPTPLEGTLQPARTCCMLPTMEACCAACLRLKGRVTLAPLVSCGQGACRDPTPAVLVVAAGQGPRRHMPSAPGTLWQVYCSADQQPGSHKESSRAAQPVRQPPVALPPPPPATHHQVWLCLGRPQHRHLLWVAAELQESERPQQSGRSSGVVGGQGPARRLAPPCSPAIAPTWEA